MHIFGICSGFWQRTAKTLGNFLSGESLKGGFCYVNEVALGKPPKDGGLQEGGEDGYQGVGERVRGRAQLPGADDLIIPVSWSLYRNPGGQAGRASGWEHVEMGVWCPAEGMQGLSPPHALPSVSPPPGCS